MRIGLLLSLLHAGCYLSHDPPTDDVVEPDVQPDVEPACSPGAAAEPGWHGAWSGVGLGSIAAGPDGVAAVGPLIGGGSGPSGRLATVDLGGGQRQGDQTGFYVAVFDRSGAPRWSLLAGERAMARDVAFDEDGDLILVGSFSGALDLGDGARSPSGTSNGFVVAFDPTGRLAWFQELQSAYSAAFALQSQGPQIAVLARATGDVRVDGLELPGDPTQDDRPFVVRLGPRGQVQSLVPLDRPGCASCSADLQHFAVRPDGGTLVAGTRTVDDVPYVAAYDATGALESTRDLPASVEPTGLAFDEAGQTWLAVFAMGRVVSENDLQIGDVTLHVPRAPIGRTFLVRFDPSGVPDLALDPSGGGTGYSQSADVVVTSCATVVAATTEFEGLAGADTTGFGDAIRVTTYELDGTVRARQSLPEAALWRTALAVDPNGRATVAGLFGDADWSAGDLVEGPGLFLTTLP